MLQTANVSNQVLHGRSIGCRARMMDLMHSDFTAVKSTLPACAMIPNQQNFTGTMSDSTYQPSSRTAKSGKVALLSRAIKHSDIHNSFLTEL